MEIVASNVNWQRIVPLFVWPKKDQTPLAKVNTILELYPCFSYYLEHLEHLEQESHEMIRISSTEFGKEVGRYQDAALTQPVIVTRNGRDRTVMISSDEYHRLIRLDRQVLSIDDFTDAEIEAIRLAEPSQSADTFNRELKS